MIGVALKVSHTLDRTIVLPLRRVQYETNPLSRRELSLADESNHAFLVGGDYTIAYSEVTLWTNRHGEIEVKMTSLDEPAW